MKVPVQVGDESALQLADFSRRSALAFIAGLEARHPLYIDLTHPIKQAVLEVCHGLKKLVQNAKEMRSGSVSSLIELASFPASAGASSSPRLYLYWLCGLPVLPD